MARKPWQHEHWHNKNYFSWTRIRAVDHRQFLVVFHTKEHGKISRVFSSRHAAEMFLCSEGFQKRY